MDVNEFKTRERHKWNLSMAKNNASTILARDIFYRDHMKQVIKELYKIYNEIDEELKEELPN